MKLTKNSKKILELLKKKCDAMNAKEIHSSLENADLATVYRNLNKLVEAGKVRELRITRGESTYEINEDGHEHAICSECGKVSHVKLDKEALMKMIDIEDFVVEDIEINVKGHCK